MAMFFSLCYRQLILIKMKTKVVTINSKTPELRGINDLGAKGWSLEQVKDIHNEGQYKHTEYHYHKTPLITHLLLFLFNWRYHHPMRTTT